MRRRLRKKLHLGEFQALGFEVGGTLVDQLDDVQADRLLEDWMVFVESRGLVCGGGFQTREERFRFSLERSPRTCNDEDRETVASSAPRGWQRRRAASGGRVVPRPVSRPALLTRLGRECVGGINACPIDSLVDALRAARRASRV